MSGWLWRRVAGAIVTTLAAIIALVVLVQLLPGDPISAVLRDHPASPEHVAALRERWGLDRSVLQSIQSVVSGLARGDLGMSASEERPVATMMRERLGPTLLLGFLTLLIDFTIGLALGVWAALNPDSRRARVIGAASVAGYALPSFVVGMLLVWLFAVVLGWLPPAGMSDPLLATDAGAVTILVDRASHLVLPLATMVIASLAVPLRQQRAAVAAVVQQPWVLAARARGVSPARVAWRHCWRPALTPIVTLLGLWLPMLVAGAVFVESVFAWPGIGSLIATATAQRDLNVVIGAGILLIVVIQVGTFLADVLYRVVDPAQRHA